MKILLIAQHAEPTSGWGTLTRTTALGLTQRGHEVTLLVQKTTPSLHLPQRGGLPSPIALLSHPLLVLITAWKIHRAIRACKPDLVHVLTEPYALAMPLLSPGRRSAWVLTCCGTYAILPFAKRWSAFLFRQAYAHVRSVLAISHYTREQVLDEIRRHWPLLDERVAEKMHVYTLGIEWPENMPSRCPHVEKRFLFVGEVKERKGVLELIEACGVFRDVSSLPFHLDIIGSCGESAYVQKLRERIEELSLEDCVHFRGQVTAEDLAQAYADADVFIMLSLPRGMHFEGYGLVFLEANSRGVPVIGPRSSGCTDAIADGRSGFLVDPADPKQVAERLRLILEQRAIDPAACVAWAREHSIERQARETEAFYSAM